jgi:hypothetical protein
MMNCGVFYAVRTEFLNVVQTKFGFIGLKLCSVNYFFTNIIEVCTISLLAFKEMFPLNPMKSQDIATYIHNG